MAFDDAILRDPTTGVVIDLSLAPSGGAEGMDAAIQAMKALESGAIANPSENRTVGHYWLRDPDRAPAPEITAGIRHTWARIDALDASGITDVLLVGIGGSALGPAMVIRALGNQRMARRFHILDTVDPLAIERVLMKIDPRSTWVLVVTKSGNTVETRSAMGAVQAHWAAAGIAFEDHAICVSGPDSSLFAAAENWLDRFPVPIWVGGRTSVTSAVGLLPMALCGVDWRSFLDGAAAMDAWCRETDSPAVGLASAWYATGRKDLVMLPYIDAYEFLGRYLQQLVMESIGKSHTRDGQAIHHGRTVYGNKGSADQHAILQQLMEGPNEVLIHLIDQLPEPSNVAGLQTLNDTQAALLSGTRSALHAAGRPIVSITLPNQGAASLGALVALFERTVSLYAELHNINAYDQPGVEAGKLASASYADQISSVSAALTHEPQGVDRLSTATGLNEVVVWRIATLLSTTGRAIRMLGKRPHEDRFRSA